MRDEQPRGNLYLLTGLVIGLALGLLISLRLFPVRYANANPALLKAEHKDEYRLLIVDAWRTDGNLPRALQRLGLLRDEEPANALASQAVRMRGAGAPPDEAKGLSDLAEVVRKLPPAAGTAQPQSTAAPEATSAPAEESQPSAPPADEPAGDTPAAEQPTVAPSSNAGMTFALLERKEVCDDSLPAGYVVVEVEDSAGGPLAGVKVDVAWEGGNDSFYTGLSPKVSLGYGDFQMKAGVKYTVQVGGGEAAGDINIPACGGAVHLQYQQTE